LEFGIIFDGLRNFGGGGGLNTPTPPSVRHCSSRQKHQDWKEGERCGRWWRVTLHVQTCSGLNRTSSLWRVGQIPTAHRTRP